MTLADETPEPAPPNDAPAATEPRGATGVRSRAHRVSTALVGVVVVASVLGPIARSGLWDPYELDVADFSRRIAATIFGDDSLKLEGAENSVPILADLGRGELPFTSAALGFRLFGLQDWAGRLALATWGLLGIAAMHLLTWRLAGARVAAFGSLVLATTPIYFLHCRTLLGDIVTMSAIACTLAGFGILLFDDSVTRRWRWALGALGVVGIAAGFTSRGAALGVGVPTAALGATWWLSRGAQATPPQRRANAWIGALLSTLGVVGLALGVAAVFAFGEGNYSELAGVRVEVARKLPTFEAFVRHLGHGMFPYSALLPVAFAAVARSPRTSSPGVDRESVLRILLLSTATIAFGVHASIGMRVGPMPFVAVPALAVLAAVALVELSTPDGWSLAGVLCVASGLVILLLDISGEPERVFQAFGVTDPSFPEAMNQTSKRVFRYGPLGVLLVFLLVHAEVGAESREDRVAFALKDFRQFPAWVWAGLRARLASAVRPWRRSREGEVPRGKGWRRGVDMATSPLQLGAFLCLAVLSLVPLAVVAGALVARDAVRCFFRLPVRRCTVAVTAFAAFGLTLSLSYFPALASQISPKSVFESFREHAGPDDELAIMGGQAGGARYYVGTSVPSFSSSTRGFQWLSDAPADVRRWLVIRDEDLPRMNSMHREETEPPANLPIVSARSSEVLLAVSRLPDGVVNANPVDPWVRSTPPEPSHPMSVDFNGQLECLGWDLLDMTGSPVHQISRGEDYQFALYFHVTAKVTGSWQTFIHLDKDAQRYNGDHETLGGHYPFRHWNVGDYIADIHTIRLQETLPAGTYTAYFGLYSGKSRLKVARGPHAEDRVNGGTFRVR